ncbi:MAG: hypothetical protein KA132_03090 [Thauera sp.]|nr:hypothetical protein [Thauera sp.]
MADSPVVLISFPFVEGCGGWHIPLGAACVEALQAMGFRVETFNPVVEGSRGAGWKALERLAVLGGRCIGRSKASIKSSLPWSEDARRYKGLLAKVAEVRPDYLLVISTFTYPARVLDRVRELSPTCRTIGWCVEGPTWIGRPNDEADLYDHYFCIHRKGISNPKIQYLPALGYDPQSYQRVEGCARTRELVFVGREKKALCRFQWNLTSQQTWQVLQSGPTLDEPHADEHPDRSPLYRSAWPAVALGGGQRGAEHGQAAH